MMNIFINIQQKHLREPLTLNLSEYFRNTLRH
jgi:hypothetical protein